MDNKEPVKVSDSVLASNRLWNVKSAVRRERWFYVRSGEGQWWNTKGNRWVPRFISIDMNLEDGAPADEREGYLRIFKSEDEKTPLKEVMLGSISSVDKKFLRESDAKLFPIRAPNGAPKVYLDEQDITEASIAPEGDEFRWGHVILTFAGVGLYCELCCGTTKVRDEWKEWFEDYLILQETEKMGKIAPLKSAVPKLEERHVKDYIKTFKNHQFSSGEDAREVISPCATLDKTTTPTKEVMWMGDGEEKPTLKRLKASITHDGTRLHVCDMVLGVKSVGRLTLNLNEYTFVATKQWSNTLDFMPASGEGPGCYTLSADNVEQRDQWLRWLQYVKSIPQVDRDVLEGGKFDWREVTLLPSTSPKMKANDKKFKCYYSLVQQKLAFKEFPSVVKWESATDDAGRTVYKDSGDNKIRTRDAQVGQPYCAEHAYDIYEDYFQPLHVTFPQVAAEERSEQSENGENPGGKMNWSKFRAKIKFLMRVSGNTEDVRKKREAVEKTAINYESDLVDRKPFLAPWDLHVEGQHDAESVASEDAPPEIEKNDIPLITVDGPMTLLQAKEKYGGQWDDMTGDQRRQVLTGGGELTEAQAKKEVFALPYSVINNAKDIVGLATWRKMSFRRQLDECRKYKHLAGPEKGLRLLGILPGAAESPKMMKPKRSFAAKQALLKGLRSGALNKVVDEMEVEEDEPPPSPEPSSPGKGKGSVREGDVFIFTTTKTGVAWEGDDTSVWVKNVAEGSVAEELGVKQGMVLKDVDGAVIKSKEDLKQAKDAAKRKGRRSYRLVTPPAKRYHIDITSPTILQPAVPYISTSLSSPVVSLTQSSVLSTPRFQSPPQVLPVSTLRLGSGSPCSPLPMSSAATRGEPKMWCYVKEKNSSGGLSNKKRWCVGNTVSGAIVVSKLVNGVLQTVDTVKVERCPALPSGGLGLTVGGLTLELQSTLDRDSWLAWVSSVSAARPFPYPTSPLPFTPPRGVTL